MAWFTKDTGLVEPEAALPGRSTPMPVPPAHHVNGHPLTPPWPAGIQTAVFGTGCFWGTEEIYWQLPGVYSTAVGYAGGFTPNPTYEEVCSGRTGHAEVVLVAFDPAEISYADLLASFWEQHDPTQGMRQGNDVGSQYRSVILTVDDGQAVEAAASARTYAAALDAAGFGTITTEMTPRGPFYYAEPYHQQYLAKNPHGYRCHASTGVPFPGAHP